MFHSLKGKFLLVQDGISASIRGFKAKDGQSENAHSSINYYAGAEIVMKNEKQWKEIHELFEENAKKASAIDKTIHLVHEDMNKKLQNIQEVTNFLGGIPKFSKKIESISSTLGKKLQGWYRYEESECWSIQKIAEEAERVLVIFEDMVEAEEYKRKEMNEQFAFSEYCHKKTREIEMVKKKLEEEYFEKLSVEEKKMKDTLKERQELFNMAFQQDMQLYKESGIVPKFRVNDTSSGITLEDVVIEDDLKDLNELLES